MAVSHHELCFGCGSANLFGLQIELEPRADRVAGRFFVKQDHQGPAGSAHGGVIAAALEEAMSLALFAAGLAGRTSEFHLDLHGAAPPGTFVQLEARIDRRDEDGLWASALAAAADGDPRLAEARARFVDVRDHR